MFFLIYRRILRILRRAIFIDCPGRERVSVSPKTLWISATHSTIFQRRSPVSGEDMDLAEMNIKRKIETRDQSEDNG